ncbi:AAA family ATPase [Paenibacillus sp. FJAT-26967]|uniref:AAA family ATPase n=1 Tax=Paenibacillus sp. FJAT-26967 TaxID=1729690 RepID=UPI000838EEBD|nr:SMC family ATPase [Paenibacillus sp. FJAT-26967]
MRPIMLQMSGLQSYRETQEIDFTQLCDAGVFGIFGPTGSGKSSILDAITLALYGKVERASGGTQGIMNHAENTLAVSFTFQLSYPEGPVRYRVDRQFKRGTDVSVTNTVSRFVRLSGEEPVVLADKSTDVTHQVQHVLGLSMQDFTRAVVLPQGKFAEFLSLTGKDRRQMLQRLFHLEAYGDQLSARVSGKLKEADGLLKQLAARQQGLGDASAEALASAEQRRKEADLYAAEQRKTLQEAVKRHDEMKSILSLQEEVGQIHVQRMKLEQEESAVRAREERVKRAEEAEKLRPYVEHQEAAAAAETKQRSRLEETRILAEEADRKLTAAAQVSGQAQAELGKREEPLLIRLEHLNQALEQEKELEALYIQCRDMQQQEKELTRELVQTKEAYRKESDTKDKALARQAELKEALKSVQVGYELRSKLQQAMDDKRQLDGDKRRLSELAAENKRRQEQIRTKEQEAAASAREMKVWAGDLVDWMGRVLEEQQETSGLREQLHTSEAAAIRLLEARRAEERAAELDQLAAKLAEQLQVGEACPVCGAVEHPAPHHNRSLPAAGRPAADGLREIEECEKLIQQYRTAGVQADKHLLALDALVKRAKEHGSTDSNQALLQATGSSVGMIAEAAAATASAEGESGSDLPENPGSLENSSSPDPDAEDNGNRLADAWKRMEARMRLFAMAAAELEEAYQSLLRRLRPLESAARSSEAELRSLRGLLQADEAKASALEQAIREQDAQWHERHGADGLKQEDVEARLKQLHEQEQQAEELSARIEKSIPFIDGVLAKLEQLRNDSAELDKTVLQLTTKLQGLTQLAAEKSQQLQGRAGSEPVPRQIEAAAAELEALRSRCERAKQAHEASRREQQEAAQGLSAAVQAAASAERQLAEALERLSRALEASAFADAAAVQAAYVGEAERSAWAAAARIHREREQTLRSRLAQLNTQLAGRSVTGDDWAQAQQLLLGAQASDEAALAARARAERDCEELQAKHEQWRGLEDQRAEQETLHGRLVKLQSVLKANAFVEFLAEEQLMQVSRAASQRLGQLTRQRYAIEVDSGGGFVIRDDGSGGVKRPVGTLSGGETFLTSLALALALSAQIQLKGEVPLEFFFLDEGFGTLDPDLLDMVVTSLEKLHMDRLAVGVISHVPELRARLPRKLIVDPAEPSGRGSRVRLELL